MLWDRKAYKERAKGQLSIFSGKTVPVSFMIALLSLQFAGVTSNTNLLSEDKYYCTVLWFNVPISFKLFIIIGLAMIALSVIVTYPFLIGVNQFFLQLRDMSISNPNGQPPSTCSQADISAKWCFAA